MDALIGIWTLAQQWLSATVAVLQLAPQPAMTPVRAGYYAACMVEAQQSYGIPWVRLAAIIQHESQWREGLVSATNDYGLGQHHCPSFFCSREPTPAERVALLHPCVNIQLTAEELARARHECRHCGDYVQRYNPGNPTYAKQIARWEDKVRAAARGPRAVRVAWGPNASVHGLGASTGAP
jgi:hypothetical protein